MYYTQKIFQSQKKLDFLILVCLAIQDSRGFEYSFFKVWKTTERLSWCKFNMLFIKFFKLFDNIGFYYMFLSSYV